MMDKNEIFLNEIVLPSNWEIMESRINDAGKTGLDQRFKIIEEIIEFYEAKRLFELTPKEDPSLEDRLNAMSFELADVVISSCTLLRILGVKYIMNHFLAITDLPMYWIRQVSEGFPQYVIWNAFDYAEKNGINLEEAITEKLEYNKTRTDWPKTGVK